MQWKPPKNSNRYYWTLHVQGKMRYYGLSEQKILGVIRKPFRSETGIAQNTVAVMQPVNAKLKEGKQEWNQEIWVMYQMKAKNKDSKVKEETRVDQLRALLDKDQLTIISAWRFPGVSDEKNPIPSEIMREIEEFLN